jgi:hypothetical protein
MQKLTSDQIVGLRLGDTFESKGDIPRVDLAAIMPVNYAQKIAALTAKPDKDANATSR